MDPRILVLLSLLLACAAMGHPQRPVLYFDHKQPGHYFVQDLHARDASAAGLMYYSSPVDPLPGFFIKPTHSESIFKKNY